MTKKILIIVTVLILLLTTVGLCKGRLEEATLKEVASRFSKIASSTSLEMRLLSEREIEKNLRAFQYQGQDKVDPTWEYSQAVPLGDCDDWTVWVLANIWASPDYDDLSLGFILIDPDSAEQCHVAPVVCSKKTGVLVIEHDADSREYAVLTLSIYLSRIREIYGESFNYRLWYIRPGVPQQPPPRRKVILEARLSNYDIWEGIHPLGCSGFVCYPENITQGR